MKDYGLLLKNAREARKLTQEQAAEAVGVSPDSWYAYEANKHKEQYPEMAQHYYRAAQEHLALI